MKPLDTEELYRHAVKLVVEEQRCSTIFLQRMFALNYVRASEIMARLERDGIVGEYVPSQSSRSVLVTEVPRDIGAEQ